MSTPHRAASVLALRTLSRAETDIQGSCDDRPGPKPDADRDWHPSLSGLPVGDGPWHDGHADDSRATFRPRSGARVARQPLVARRSGQIWPQLRYASGFGGCSRFRRCARATIRPGHDRGSRPLRAMADGTARTGCGACLELRRRVPAGGDRAAQRPIRDHALDVRGSAADAVSGHARRARKKS